MTKDILIASSNSNKIEEIEQIIDLPGISFQSLKAYRKIPAIEEDGKTFEENAIMKAKYYYKAFEQPVIADDSGLIVPALNGEPGIYSARYAGENSGYAENNALLLSKMKTFIGNQRDATFISVVVYYDGDQLISAEGKVSGFIIKSSRGEGGFGYDPLFYYPPAQKTFAEMEPEAKNQVSHRYRALQLLRQKFDKMVPNKS